MKKRIIALVTLVLLLAAILIPVAYAAKCSHSWEWRTEREPTCYKTGLRREHCSKQGCTATRLSRSIATKPHNWSDYTTEREPTCQLQGLKKRHCTNPGCIQTESQAIPRVQHNFQFVQIKTQPTCTKPGKMEYKCTWCPMHDYPEIPALQHNYSNGKCTRCGEPQK